MSSQLIIIITLVTALAIVVMLLFATLMQAFRRNARYTVSLMLGMLSSALRDIKSIHPVSPIVMPGYGTRPEANTEIGKCLHAFDTYIKIWHVTLRAMCEMSRAALPNLNVKVTYHGLVLARPENSEAPLMPVGYQFDVHMDFAGTVYHRYPIIANEQLDDVSITLLYHGLLLDNLVEHMVESFKE